MPYATFVIEETEEQKAQRKLDREKVLEQERKWHGVMCTDKNGQRSTYKGTFGWTLDRSMMR